MKSDFSVLSDQLNLSKNDAYDIVSGYIKLNCYLEMSSDCNCSCSFCRNQFFESKNYDFKNILSNLSLILPYLKEINIGGGEPTLRMNDLISLKKTLTYITKLRYITNYEILKAMENNHIICSIHNYLGVMSEILKSRNNIYNKSLKRINFVVFSNGTSSLENYEKLIDEGFSLVFSRHHYDDIKNKEIFNASTDILNGNEIGSLYGKIQINNSDIEQHYSNRHEIPYVNLRTKNVYFNSVLNQNGLKSIQDISDYLYWIASLNTGEYYGEKMDVVFSDLECNTKCNETAISKDLIHSIDDWFIRDKGRIILSSSGYTITPYRFDVPHFYHKKQRFYVKEYVDQESLEEMWKYATASEYQKVIDLSMDSEGNIYQDYQQTKRLL